MPLIIIDALPSGQVLINTDQIVQARSDQGRVTLYLTGDQEVGVPHESVDALLDDIWESVAAVEAAFEKARSPAVPI
ncbi:hypothetical protein [Sphingomonas sp. ACRSK]|uniref:hypothetical protein n=1 Tax=Sphingomonas sp. ACRSK TaxID=2918213 RepID=UPI001EF4C94C|nr:hypothetical protein [Sphingomonas sp. ACRSK]MCG7346615.1 hypothetical protein [Sphingomonas sp. ACRSK]